MSERDPYASFKELRRQLLRGARPLAHSRADAEDLVQAAFERWFGLSYAANLGDDEARRLLQTIVKRLAIDRSRRSKRWRFAAFDDAVHAEEAREPSSARHWLELSAPQLTAALERCSASDREAFELHYVRGLGYREIAARLGIAMGTLATRLHRVRRHLRSELERLLECR